MRLKLVISVINHKHFYNYWGKHFITIITLQFISHMKRVFTYDLVTNSPDTRSYCSRLSPFRLLSLLPGFSPFWRWCDMAPASDNAITPSADLKYNRV
jgi:hypothetical protein